MRPLVRLVQLAARTARAARADAGVAVPARRGHGAGTMRRRLAAKPIGSE